MFCNPGQLHRSDIMQLDDRDHCFPDPYGAGLCAPKLAMHKCSGGTRVGSPQLHFLNESACLAAPIRTLLDIWTCWSFQTPCCCRCCEHCTNRQLCRLQTACRRLRRLLPLTLTSRAFPGCWLIDVPKTRDFMTWDDTSEWDGYVAAYLVDCSGKSFLPCTTACCKWHLLQCRASTVLWALQTG